MNYSQKRTIVGRAIYIALTLMAVTVLVVSMYVFIGGSKRSDKKETPITEPSVTTSNNVVRPPQVTDKETEKNDPDTKDTEELKPTNVTPAKDWTRLKVVMPVDGIVYKKHDPENMIYSVTMNDYRVHQGIDIECNEGDEAVSCAYGVVKAVGYDPFMGYTVIIDHGDGLISCYRNLSEDTPERLQEGTTVMGGEIIGTVGESAIIEISDEPHLHFELELNGKAIDPLSMLEYDENTAAENIVE